MVDKWYPIGGSEGDIHIASHLAGPGMPSWELLSFHPKRPQFAILVTDIGSRNRCLGISFAQDSFQQFSAFGWECLEHFGFLLTDPTNDVLQSTVYEHSGKAADAAIALFSIPVTQFDFSRPREIPCEQTIKLTGIVNETLRKFPLLLP
jgi:hypothetical protein